LNRFAHLHTHSEHSLLDGTIKAEALMKRCRDHGMTSVAVTDHGTLGGIWQMRKAAKKFGVNYIPGVEAYIVPDVEKCRGTINGKVYSNKGGSNHIVLLAQDSQGYKNLVALMSEAFNRGFYTQPRIDYDMLERYNEGIICLSACLGSELAEALRDNQMIGLIADRYKSIFGDRYFLEIQLNGEEEQVPYNKALIKLSGQMDIPLVATNDAHYLVKDHSEMQDINFCLGMRKVVSDPKRHKFNEEMFSIETPDEIHDAFAAIGQRDSCFAAANLAETCDVKFAETKVFIPSFASEEETDEQRFRRLAQAGLAERFPEIPDGYQERLDYEFEVIERMGYPSYFLVVAEYIQIARDMGIRVGPGRGSGAGSLAAYCMGITDLDPVEYGLYFERFLNPHRVSMPDFDTDFQRSRRDELVEALAVRFGNDKVAHIGTASIFKPKGLVRDIARVLGHGAERQSEFAKAIPDEDRGGQGRHRVTLSTDVEYDEHGKPKRHYCILDKTFKAKYEGDKDFRKICDLGAQIESLRRHTSIHASGIIIHDKPLGYEIPLGRVNPKTTIPVTEWDMKEVEDAGYVKYDFLGLAALDVIDLAVNMIQETVPGFDVVDLDLEDADVYANIFDTGSSYGVFQMEKKGMRSFAKAFRPRSIDELSAVLALYRPGPMDNGMLKEILKVRGGGTLTAGWTSHPSVVPILASTDGVLVYQEQVLKIAQDLAGFSLAEADLMRRAIGKKKPKEMAALKDQFIGGGTELGNDPAVLATAWKGIADFADYCFNKAHSVSYAIIAYQTAYLKYYYPAQFLAASMSVKAGDFAAIQDLVTEAGDAGVGVLGPDINTSIQEFTAKDEQILFGFEAIKGLGTSAIDAIILARSKGSFENIYDFVKRVHLGKCRTNNVLTLIHAGAFDSMVHTRAQLAYGYEDAILKAKRHQADRRSGQRSLFKETNDFFIPEVPPDKELELMNEHEALGIFLSGHPLDAFREVLQEKVTCEAINLEEVPDNKDVVVGGFIGRVSIYQSKSGPMAWVTLGDKTGEVEVTCFSGTYLKHASLLEEGGAVLIRGQVNTRKGEKGVIARAVASLEDLAEDSCKGLEVRISTTKDVEKLSGILPRYKGGNVWLKVSVGDGWFSPDTRIVNPNELRREISRAIPDAEVTARY